MQVLSTPHRLNIPTSKIKHPADQLLPTYFHRKQPPGARDAWDVAFARLWFLAVFLLLIDWVRGRWGGGGVGEDGESEG